MLIAASLFGNDAAEDEDEEVFLGYVVDRPEIAAFLDPSRRICIARAFKGEGKSALLRAVHNRLTRRGDDAPLVISVTGRQLSPAQTGDDSDAWVRDWKRTILQLIARELGSRIGTAWSDDAISLVEEAEQAGFKSRSIVSAIFDRLKSSTVPVQRERLVVANAEKLVQRWADRTKRIWLIVDDVDENFKNTLQHRLKVASFFIAAREIRAIGHVRSSSAMLSSSGTSRGPRRSHRPRRPSSTAAHAALRLPTE